MLLHKIILLSFLFLQALSKHNHQSQHNFVPILDLLATIDTKIDGNVLVSSWPHTHLQYERERTQWNIEYNIYYPLAIIMMQNKDDIITSLKYIRSNVPFIDINVRSAELGGHLWNGYSVGSNNSIIFDLSRINTIELSQSYQHNTHTNNNNNIKNNVFKIGVGASQSSVNRKLEPYFQLLPTSGDCPQFSMAGFVQGGGLSLFLRSYGIAADYLVAADVVILDKDDKNEYKMVHATMDNKYADLLYGIRGGGAGNFGIILYYYMASIEVPNSVLSFEVYWKLPKHNSTQIVQFLDAWQMTQSDDNKREWTSWLVILKDSDQSSSNICDCDQTDSVVTDDTGGSDYVIRMLGIWNGDIDDGYAAWDEFESNNGLTYDTDRSNILVTTAYNAVDIHQSTFAGDEFRGIIDARTVKYEWSNEILNNIGNTMVDYHNRDDNLSYIWLFVHYGGAMYHNDPLNKYTAFGNRDAKGDITLIIGYDDDNNDRILAKDYIVEIDNSLLDSISEYYYPNHPRSYDTPDEDVNVAYYDYNNKPWLYEKLRYIKTKYDPFNVLSNPVTIEPYDSDESGRGSYVSNNGNGNGNGMWFSKKFG